MDLNQSDESDYCLRLGASSGLALPHRTCHILCVSRVKTTPTDIINTLLAAGQPLWGGRGNLTCANAFGGAMATVTGLSLQQTAQTQIQCLRRDFANSAKKSQDAFHRSIGKSVAAPQTTPLFAGWGGGSWLPPVGAQTIPTLDSEC